jgi:hypothetical protein
MFSEVLFFCDETRSIPVPGLDENSGWHLEILVSWFRGDYGVRKLVGILHETSQYTHPTKNTKSLLFFFCLKDTLCNCAEYTSPDTCGDLGQKTYVFYEGGFTASM